MSSDNFVVNSVFGECLSRLRKTHGRSQKFIAIQAKLDASYLAGIEHGRRPPPRRPVLERILDALGATPEERLEVKDAIAIAKLARLASAELEPSYGQSLIRIASAMQFCSTDELKALEVIVQSFKHRHTTTLEK